MITDIVYDARDNSMSDESRVVGPNELRVTKPISAWNRDIKIPPKTLFRNIGKMALKGATLNWSGLGESALDTFDAAGLQKQPGEIAWLLIYRAFISAISKLTHKYIDIFENPPDEEELDEISELFEKEMVGIEVTIGLDFFERPADLRLLKDLRTPLENWMNGLGLSQENTPKVCNRLPDYFVFALNEKWRVAPEDYVQLKEYYDTPFTKATEERRGWQLYNQWLKRQVNDRMFAEPFGVEQVYVPLRGYYEEKKEKKYDGGHNVSGIDPRGQKDNIEKIVFDLESDFRAWLSHFSSKTAVRFISGGPGSGKSTFAKIFASRIANETDIPTLYIPLHLLDASDNIISATGKFVEGNRFLSGNPLDAKTGKNRLLIILDGLDELALQGKASSETANAFVDEVLRRIHEGNVQGLQRQVIITGRTIAIQSVASKLRETKQISYVLPYFLREKEGFKDEHNLLGNDQRNDWWVLYGKAKGKNYESMPNELSRKSLEEITAQPLLNYLVALSYDRQRLSFTDDTTLNQIYADLINEVYCRQYEDGRVSVCVGDLSQVEFTRVLEEIALAIWHGDGRTATVSDIQKKCKAGGIQRYLESFQEGAKAGVTRLLTAFYFRQSEGNKEGDPTFEFTHKSFGEYLTALRIIRVLRQIQTQIDRREKDPDDGWSEKESLSRWIDFCSNTAMDPDLMRFISNEFLQIDQNELLGWQNSITRLLTYNINHGLPITSGYADKGLRQLLNLFRNAEEALLAIHFLLAKITGRITRLEFESETIFSEWISRLRGQRQGPNNKLCLYSLGFLNLSGSCFDAQDFYGANFDSSIFFNSQMNMINFSEANLRYAKFEEAMLVRAHFEASNLYKADFSRARLDSAYLMRANLSGANLRKTALKDANFYGAVLIGANLIGADLVGANFENANLDGAEFGGALIDGANFDRAKNIDKARNINLE